MVRGRLRDGVKSGGAGSLLVAMLCLGALLLGITLLSSSQAFGADAGLTRVEQADTRLAYAGSWSTFSTASASGGSYKRANIDGSSVTVTFNGTHLAWIATKGTTLGKAFVSLDGGAPVSVNLAASVVAYKQSVWNTGTLSSGMHTVKIWRDPSSLTGKYISVDAVDVIGTVTQAGVQPPTATGAARYQQADSALAYQGSWSTFSTASASGGSYERANSNGSSATVSFNGTYLAWIATKGTTLGKAFVSLDGRAPVGVNLAASVVAYQQSVWNTGTLSSGTHTVKIWRDPSSLTGKYISVDAVDVVGSLVDPPSPTYYVDATHGNDSNNGTSTATPWKTLSKVRNSVTPNNPYPAGTRILLKRGETWREQLRFYANSTAGTASKRVTVGAYGTGAKPLILGSLNRSSASNWTETSAGSHIWWTTCGIKDIGNIVFDGGTSMGQKHFKSTSVLTPKVPLTEQGDFYFHDGGTSYYGSTATCLYMYSVGNPGSVYSEIECCQEDMWNGVYDNSYITVQDLEFKYSSDMGAMFVMGGGMPTRGVGQILERCDFSFGGGSEASGWGVRDGYGVMFWMNGTDITVRDCTFDEMWNKPFSLQCNNTAGTSRFTDIYVYRNVLKHSMGACDVWLYSRAGNTAKNFSFVNNTIYNMGEGLMEPERHNSTVADRVGFFFDWYGTFTNCAIKNNIFYGDEYYFHKLKTRNAPTYWDLSGWDIDYNCYYPDSSAAFIDNGTAQTLAQWRGNPWAPDAHSIASDPLFMDAAGGDFRLRAGSRCLGAGLHIPGISSSQTPNIGAF